MHMHALFLSRIPHYYLTFRMWSDPGSEGQKSKVLGKAGGEARLLKQQTFYYFLCKGFLFCGSLSAHFAVLGRMCASMGGRRACRKGRKVATVARRFRRMPLSGYRLQVSVPANWVCSHCALEPLR